MSSSADNSAIDVDRKRQLAEKYRLERGKRLNPKGNAQYIAVEGVFADFSRIAMVGTGSTGVQIVPVVASDAQQRHVRNFSERTLQCRACPAMRWRAGLR